MNTIACFSALFGAAVAARAQVVFTQLERPTGTVFVSPWCLNSDGRVAGGTVYLSPSHQALIWVDGVAVPIGGDGTVYGLSPDAGLATGALWDGSAGRAFLSQPPATPAFLPLLAGDFRECVGYGVSAAGVVVGFYRFGNPSGVPVRWDPDGAHLLEMGGHATGTAWGITPDARKVVGVVEWVSPNYVQEAAWWDEQGGLHPLRLPAGDFSGSIARDVSGDGSVIVGSLRTAAGPQLPVRWVAGVPTVLSATHMAGSHVSDDGWRVITAEPQIWDPVTGWRTVDSIMAQAGLSFPPDWVFPSLWDISGDGTVVLGQSRTLQPQRSYGWTLRIPRFCYANCDGSTASPALNVLDFNCFLNRFTAADLYADCNLDGATNVLDFNCFLNRFVLGCP